MVQIGESWTRSVKGNKKRIRSEKMQMREDNGLCTLTLNRPPLVMKVLTMSYKQEAQTVPLLILLIHQELTTLKGSAYQGEHWRGEKWGQRVVEAGMN